MEHVGKHVLFQDSEGESDGEEDKTPPTKIRSNGTIMCLDLPCSEKTSSDSASGYRTHLANRVARIQTQTCDPMPQTLQRLPCMCSEPGLDVC